MERLDLVVIGNGMAGARAVEEILARGGGERFRITMFGDEPYGNYNRIMLSHVLAGQDADEIYLNPVDWYAENDITLHAGVRVVRVDRFARKVLADNGAVLAYDKLIIATGSRTFFPPMDGMWVDDRTLTPGVFGFRTMDDTTAMLDYARDHHSAVVIGGGLLGLEAAYGLQQHGLAVHVVQGGPVLMNQQLDEEAGAIRDSLGEAFLRVTPGIRLLEDSAGDQKRVMTPRLALESGSSYLVIGRPVTRAAQPLEVLARINSEVATLENGK